MARNTKKTASRRRESNAAARPAGAKTQGQPNRKATRGVPPVDVEGRIRERAYELYLSRGGEPGRALSDWLQAESEIRTGSTP